jgi:hypothetical protein
MPSKLPIDVDDASSTSTYGPSQLPTPPYSSGQTSPTLQEPEEFLEPSVPAKKKKKKKPKKSTKAKDAAAKNKETPSQEPRPPVLCISRNKHWRYISSYHVRFPTLHSIGPSTESSAFVFRARGSNCLSRSSSPCSGFYWTRLPIHLAIPVLLRCVRPVPALLPIQSLETAVFMVSPIMLLPN